MDLCVRAGSWYQLYLSSLIPHSMSINKSKPLIHQVYLIYVVHIPRNHIRMTYGLDFVHIIANDAKSWIIDMDSKKSTGYDGFSVKLLKVGADPLSMIISELINMSIDECTFQDLLKYAEIAALFNKLDRLRKENYRPVSILTALSKVFEKMYCHQLTSYFDRIFSK